MVDLTAERGFRSGAAEQFGVIHRDQLLAEGLTAHTIKTRLARHELRALLPETYLIGGSPETWHSHLMAAQLWADDCFISHRSAAALWELDGCTGEGPVEVSLYSSKANAKVVTHRLRPDDRPALRHIGPLRVSAPERTLLDLASHHPKVAQLALEDALRRKLCTLDRLWEVCELDGGRGRKGSRRLKEILTSLDERSTKVRSALEQKMLALLSDVEPEGLVADYPVRDGRVTYYIDFAYPLRRLGIETLGLKWHFGTLKWQRDLARDRHLTRLGWKILYFTWDDVVRTPRIVEQEVRSFLILGP